jgi:uncharacterized protein YodC (DUF2158 family)
MSQNVDIGDVVQLKSGGPKMTVAAGPGNFGLICLWFSGDELKNAEFPQAALVKASTTPASTELSGSGTPAQ